MVTSHWSFLTESVAGRKHTNTESPNQDAVGSFSGPGSRLPVVLAVSDGHGSEKCPRSHVGSFIAVQTALQICREFCDSSLDDSLDAIKRKIGELPRDIVREWRRRVLADIERYPLDDGLHANNDAESVASNRPQRDHSIRPEKPYLEYGATLLAVLIDHRFVVSLQLGDGNIIGVFEDGRADSLTRTSDHVADDTDSLCMSRADELLQVNCFTSSDHLPHFVLLCTDGYSKAFPSDDDLLRAATDFFKLMRTPDGMREVEGNLENWLKDHSEYSGDDASLCIAFRHWPPAPDIKSSSKCVSTEQIDALSEGETELEPPNIGTEIKQLVVEEGRTEDIVGKPEDEKKHVPDTEHKPTDVRSVSSSFWSMLKKSPLKRKQKDLEKQ